jgi:transposase-like protein
LVPDLACGEVRWVLTALRDVYPTTKEQRCWVHKMANITGAMPKPMHEKAKAGYLTWQQKGGRRRLQSIR